ncbi:hypothetical protein L3Y34_005265 [Caenorhabditis briggsae]|uniref:Uncharacterized protein n=1 Tax=Caenorhabditis briggsae TaxID=6238 RepID=A0AAE9AJ74_CAEBR|nr:hypothetical protein L3Y34_005265 [Caenorhabditis briggsae]
MSQSENLKSPEDSDSDLELLPTSAYPNLSDFELDKIAREEFDREAEFREIQEELEDAKLKIQRLKIKDKEKDNEIENIQKEIGNLNSKLEYQTDQSHLNFSSSQLLVQGCELFQSAATQMTKIHEENLAIIEGLKLNIASLQEKLRIKDEQLEEKEKKLKERKCSKQKKVEVKTSPDPPKAVAVHVPVSRVTQWFEDYPDPIERPIIENKIPPVKDPNEPVDEEAKKNGKIPINRAPPIPTIKKPELKKA